MNPMLSRRAMLSVTFATAAGFVLAACGDNSNEESAAGAPGGHAEPNAFPVTIDHKFGSTTIEQAPVASPLSVSATRMSCSPRSDTRAGSGVEGLDR